MRKLTLAGLLSLLVLTLALPLKPDGLSGFGFIAENAGSVLGLALRLNCSTNTTCTYSGGTATITSTGGGSGITALTQDVSATGPGSVAATVQGLETVPFCTGYTPTNGQFVQYTTASSPDPCYGAASGGGGGGGSSVNVIQSVGCRGSPVTTCAFGQNVTSGHLCIAALGWTGTTASNPTATDTVGTTYTVKVGLNGTSVSNVAVLAGVCGGTGANTITVTWPAGSSFEGIHPIEAQGVSGTTDGTATGSISSNTQDYASIASITTGTAGDLVIMVVDGQNSTPGIDVACYSMTAQVAFSQGEDSGGVCAVIQNAAGRIANGAYNNSGLGYSIAMVALKHS